MSVEVDLAELADKAAEHRFAYLVTVGDDQRAKPVAVRPQVDGATVTLPSLGDGTRANLAARPDVVLVFPPPEAGGFSLLVDAQAEVDGDGARLTATHAVLHRPADR